MLIYGQQIAVRNAAEEMASAKIHDEQRRMARRLLDYQHPHATRKRFNGLVQWEGSPSGPSPKRNATPREAQAQNNEYTRCVPDHLVPLIHSYV
jgi:hypothetical protein